MPNEMERSLIDIYSLSIAEYSLPTTLCTELIRAECEHSVEM